MNTKLLGAALGALLAGRPAPAPIPVPALQAPVASQQAEASFEDILSDRLMAALEASTEVAAEQLVVTVEGTKVTLEGEVSTIAEIEVAVRLAFQAGATVVRTDFDGFDNAASD